MDINNVTYEWQFPQMEIYPTSSGHTDMIFNIHWELNATTGSYLSNKTGIIDLPYNPDDVWIEYSDLTKADIQVRIEDRMNRFNENAVIELKEKLAQEIENQINPPSILVKAPWL
jgi:hypothetical protein